MLPVFEISKGRCSCGDLTCNSAGKHPRAGIGLKHASDDLDTIERWSKQWPDCNWAVACSRSGFIAIDVDPRAGGNATFKTLVEKLGELPKGPLQKTGGDGRHYLLTVPKKTKLRGKLGPGVDVKANGYILVEPSNHISSGRYVWSIPPGRHPIPAMDETWLKATEKPSKRLKPAKVVPFRRDTENEIESALEHIDADDYHQWRDIGMAVKDAMGEAGFAIWDKWSQSSDKYEPNKIRKQWDGFKGKGITKATLFQLAYDNGWTPPKVEIPKPPDLSDKDVPPDLEFTQSKRQSGASVEELAVNQGVVVKIDPAKADWRQCLEYDKNNRLTRDPGNAALVLSNDEQWQDCLQFNEFTQCIEWATDPPLITGFLKPEGEYRDSHINFVQHWLLLTYGGSFSKDSTFDAIKTAAEVNKYHPIRNYLNSLQWDGQKRLHLWLTTYFGAEDRQIISDMGKWWLISAIARVMQPGCKVDHMLILEGPQGCGKSTGLNVLGSQWYKDGIGDIKSKDAMQDLSGNWIVEISELDAFRGQRATTIKQYITKQVDNFRLPYGKIPIRIPRQCVFAGTTNKESYLQDETGDRRFWPVKVNKLELEKLGEDRDQIWAEALRAYRNKESWHPTTMDHSKILAVEQSARFKEDPWHEKISKYLENQKALGNDGVSFDDIYIELDIPVGMWDLKSQMRIGKILTKCLWRKSRCRLGGKRITRYFPPEWPIPSPPDNLSDNLSDNPYDEEF